MKQLILVICALFFSYRIECQVIKATTEDGRKVLLFKNGTWMFDDTLKTEVIDSSSKSDTTADCLDWTTTTTDKVDGTSSTYSKENLVVAKDDYKYGFSIFMMKSHHDNGLILVITA